jgi:hypothetical protein
MLVSFVIIWSDIHCRLVGRPLPLGAMSIVVRSDVHCRSFQHSLSFGLMFVVVQFDVHCRFVRCLLPLHATFVTFLFNFVRLVRSVHRCPLTNVCASMSACHRSSLLTHCIVQIICIAYKSIWYRIFQTVSSDLYYYKILGYGTTVCPRMMKALSVGQSQGISYNVTHNHVNQFIWAHDLHDGTMKRL